MDAPVFHPLSEDDLSTHLHRQVIGYLGALLPLLLFAIAGWRQTPGTGVPWAPLPSVSAYFYSGAVVAFVGVLVALSVFLLTYRGYSNAHYRLDRAAGIVAGLAAGLVAMFPTEVPWPALAPIWWKHYIGVIHYTAASVLFCCFAFYSLVLFTRTDQPNLTRGKQARNALYFACGGGILLAIAWIVALELRHQQRIFVPEVVALELFAISWLAKGRAEWTAGQLVTRGLHYGRHPRQAVADLGATLRRPPPVPPSRH